MLENQESREVKNKPNPFSSSRVDTPFQNHPDLTSIYHNQFTTLTSTITDIKYDPNHQSEGAVVIGRPGTGKTHLMMRLANRLLKYNRLLFIRQPNNPDAVIYHTYSRILESLIKKVPQSDYTQIEYLLANSFVKLININSTTANQKDKYFLENTKNNSLKLYDSLGAEGTQRQRESWQHIEKRILEWWEKHYSTAGYSLEIIKGIIKFCRYSDADYKRLVTRWLAADNLEQQELEKIKLSNWNESISKEAFSLEAITVLSKLSLLDEPLIIVFDQLEGLGLKHNETLLLSFGEAIKEIFTHVPNSLIILNLFPDRWQQFQQIFDGSIVDRISQHQVILEKPTPVELKQILQTKAELVGVNIETLFTSEELKDIISHNSIRAILNRANVYYRYKVHNTPLPNSSTLTKTVPQQEQTVTARLQNLEERVFQLQQVLQNIAEALNIFQGFEPNIKSQEEQPTSNNDRALTQEKTKSQLSTNNQKKSSDTREKKELEKELSEIQKLSGYLEQEKEKLANKYSQSQIIDDSDDLGKLRTIIEAFKTIKSLEIDYFWSGKSKLPENLVIKKNSVNLCLGFLQISGSLFTTRLRNYNTLVVKHKDIKFVLWRDSRQASISGKVANEEITKLNNAENGNFLTMGQENRINFELIYNLIVDIQNKDLDLPLETALRIISSKFKNYWLIKILV